MLNKREWRWWWLISPKLHFALWRNLNAKFEEEDKKISYFYLFSLNCALDPCCQSSRHLCPGLCLCCTCCLESLFYLTSHTCTNYQSALQQMESSENLEKFWQPFSFYNVPEIRIFTVLLKCPRTVNIYFSVEIKWMDPLSLNRRLFWT